MSKRDELLKYLIKNAGKALLSIAVAASLTGQVSAQQKTRVTTKVGEKYGNTLNIGLGFAYYSYLDRSAPFLGINYEFDVARQFTLAPFIGIATYRSGWYYEDPMRHRYYYKQTIVPIGVKGTYYFDRILNAGPDWDFYMALSLGGTINTVRYDDGYRGRDVARDVSPLFLDLHVGTEYHISNAVGLYLDLSTGISTLGLAIHTR